MMMIDVLRPKMKPPYRYSYAEIRTRVVVICGPTRYQLDHRGATKSIEDGIKVYPHRVLASMRSFPSKRCVTLN